ncbi:hypothetical protein [Tritonibacter horizontis]|uniref:Uncharacterized protein n=1 Tax=Tritonibacter horizontis TaxID=1768241 RepID=A0A132BTP4_9RHOB|nr:hypothetical protein [Tritonibacter horizontis]KUP91664.1 hypothetical protein TRIHO_34620 [Tritonibacter horizontis]
MSNVIELPKGGRDQVLIFALDMPPEQAKFLRDEEGALAQVLGVDSLDLAQAEIFPVEDLEGLGLLGYLRDGLAVSEADLSQHGLALDNVAGWVLVLRGRAFAARLEEQAVRLTPAAPLSLVARLGETRTNWSAPTPLHSDSAEPRLRHAPRAARSRARRIGATIFAVVMAALCLLIWALAT